MTRPWGVFFLGFFSLQFHNKVTCFMLHQIEEPCSLGAHAGVIVPPSWIIKVRKPQVCSYPRRAPSSIALLVDKVHWVSSCDSNEKWFCRSKFKTQKEGVSQAQCVLMCVWFLGYDEMRTDTCLVCLRELWDCVSVITHRHAHTYCISLSRHMLHCTFNYHHRGRGDSELTTELCVCMCTLELPKELCQKKKADIFQTKDKQEGIRCKWYYQLHCHNTFLAHVYPSCDLDSSKKKNIKLNKSRCRLTSNCVYKTSTSFRYEMKNSCFKSAWILMASRGRLL